MWSKLTVLLLVALVGFIRADPVPAEDSAPAKPAEETPEETPEESQDTPTANDRVEDGSQDKEDEPDPEEGETPNEDESDKNAVTENDEDPGKNDESSPEKRRIIHGIHRYRCKRPWVHCNRGRVCARRGRLHFCSRRIFVNCFKYYYGYRFCCRKWWYYCRHFWAYCYRRRIGRRYRYYCPCVRRGRYYYYRYFGRYYRCYYRRYIKRCYKRYGRPYYC